MFVAMCRQVFFNDGDSFRSVLVVVLIMMATKLDVVLIAIRKGLIIICRLSPCCRHAVAGDSQYGICRQYYIPP